MTLVCSPRDRGEIEWDLEADQPQPGLERRACREARLRGLRAPNRNDWFWRKVVRNQVAAGAVALAKQLGRKVVAGDADVDITTSWTCGGFVARRCEAFGELPKAVMGEHYARLIGAMRQCVAEGPVWLALELLGAGKPAKHVAYHSRTIEARMVQVNAWKALARCGYSWPRLVGKVRKLQWALKARCGVTVSNRDAVTLLAERGVKNAVRWVSWKSAAVEKAKRAAIDAYMAQWREE